MAHTRDEKNFDNIPTRVHSPIDNTTIIVNGKARTPSPERKTNSPNSPIIRAESPTTKIDSRTSPIITTPKKSPVASEKINTPRVETKTSEKIKPKSPIIETGKKSPVVETKKNKPARVLIAKSPRPAASPVVNNSYSEEKKKVENNSYSDEPPKKKQERVISLDKKKPPIKNRQENKDSSEDSSIRQGSPITVNPIKISASPMGISKKEPEKIKTENNNNAIAIPPQSGKPDYDSMSRDEKSKYMDEFVTKLRILKRSHPEFNFQDFPEGFTLNEIHDRYAGYVKEVVISLNCSQWRFYLVVMFLGLEAFGTKVLGLNMKDYTMSQLATINKYDSLLTEIGEKYYVAGSSTWAPEIKLMFMGASSAVVFIIIKYLTTYVGGDSMAPALQRAVESLMAGSFSTTSSNSLPSNIPAPPGMHQTESAQQNTAPIQPGGGLDIMGMLSGFLGGNAGGGAAGGGIAEMMAKAGSAFISATGNKPSEKVEANASNNTSAPRRRPKFKVPTKTDE